MRLFFGSSKKKEQQAQKAPPSKNLPDAIMKNKEAIATLEKREQLIEKKMALQEQDARTRAAAKDKRGALMALKRKKMLETELTTLMNSRMTLEQQILSLESSQTTAVAVSALATGVSAQKVMNQQLNIDNIDVLMDDMQEMQDMQNEVANVLAGGNTVMDDEELLNELDEIEAQELEAKMVDAAHVPSGGVVAQPDVAVPSVPAQSQQSTAESSRAQRNDGLTDEEADQLAALQAQLG
ncbi:vacuolar sorting protein snf7, putative [Perkinsus marinus ATCC 50983]|uniref:Vacuolar sorting protein snf7, putative n=1 Tax=Perkinsus marinus (strain ATCC 50983 / TXsc) TaxID=423536 RepID=C5LQP1_PERM5|nr:vacuolar sorting protein snf7, putative [Perkinsus marinus ATCC 50983]EER00776.1 vacuolar sorting protein snf7, putative [Perkinsus marinus ATCC 50983]|eukprot:XP_002768058.1 vacuolar sorting protein snf7, putative [Perkinsus marinus ATCC 50983]